MWIRKKRFEDLKKQVTEQALDIKDLMGKVGRMDSDRHQIKQLTHDTRRATRIRIAESKHSHVGGYSREQRESGTEPVNKVLQAVMDRLNIVIQEIPEKPRKLKALDADGLKGCPEEE